MAKTITQAALWDYLSLREAGEEISFTDVFNHFELSETQDSFSADKQALQNAITKLENMGALVASGITAPKIYLQDQLPVEIDLKFNVPKQGDKPPSVVLYDRSIVNKKAAGKKFKAIQIKLNSELSVAELRQIDKASAYIYRDADGGYIADIKDILIRRVDKALSVKAEQDTTIKAGNAPSKSSVAVEVLDEMGISHSFPQSALDEADALLAAGIDSEKLLSDPSRKDLRHIPFVTIDGERTKIRDDAVYAENDSDPENAGGHILWVALADVSHYIKPGSTLDAEAKKRGATLYVPRLTVPMFPQALAENLLSLEAYKDRACIAYELKISADGEVLNSQMHKGVMNSKAALSHDQLSHTIIGNADKVTRPLKDSVITPLISVSKALEKNSALRGVVEHSRAETSSAEEFTALPHAIVRYAMQAVQSVAGDKLAQSDKAGIFRTQPAPYKVSEDTLETLKGYGLIGDDETLQAEDITSARLNALFEAARGLDDPRGAQNAIASLLPKSKFSTENIGHFSLAVAAYAPLTSPIRDYTHILTSRRLKSEFGLNAGHAARIDFSTLDKDLENLTQAAARAKTAFAKIDQRLSASGQFNAAAFKQAMHSANSLGGLFDNQDIESAILKQMGIPVDFSDAARAEIESIMATQSNPEDLLKDPTREDLTDIPFVTIDGEDARDFDDAVHAYADDDPKNKGGHVLWVAIADVSHYVKTGSALDLEARERGNSVYLPKRVVPMLPEELSNGLCSLRPDEHRACAAYKIQINKKGRIIDRSFHQGVMKSRARLTYNQVMDGMDGNADEQVAPIYNDLLMPLINCYKLLKDASIERGAMTFGLEQLSIHVLGDDDRPEFREIKEDDSHSLIAENMIATNMCAAMDQKTCSNGVYRVHDDPSAGNIEALETLKTLNVITHTEFLNGIDKSPKGIQALIDKADACSDPELGKHMIVRLQSAAKYTTDNIGHFGLQIKPEIGYSHFTSPIRRYPDLLVHRNLKDKFNMVKGQMPSALRKEMESILEHCSATERRADSASKQVADQYCLRYLNKLDGQLLNAKIIRVSEDGLKIRLKELDLETVINIDQLPKGEYSLDTKNNALLNEDTGHVFPAGYSVNVMVSQNMDNEYGMPKFHIANPDHMLSNAMQATQKTQQADRNAPKAP
jgi:ribonuclease R